MDREIYEFHKKKKRTSSSETMVVLDPDSPRAIKCTGRLEEESLKKIKKKRDRFAIR